MHVFNRIGITFKCHKIKDFAEEKMKNNSIPDACGFYHLPISAFQKDATTELCFMCSKTILVKDQVKHSSSLKIIYFSLTKNIWASTLQKE